jgi:hypothetical protein
LPGSFSLREKAECAAQASVHRGLASPLLEGRVLKEKKMCSEPNMGDCSLGTWIQITLNNIFHCGRG